MVTPNRMRAALDQMAENQFSTNQAFDYATINVSSLGVQPAVNQNVPWSPQIESQLMGLVQNEFLSRGAFIQRWMDPRRDYNKECGYPETYELTSEKWQDYYERHPIAARVVELMPVECWQLTPDVYEDEDPNIVKPFEQAFEDLGHALRGLESTFKPDEKQAHPLWEICRRADIASRIGQYGVILFGFDDRLSLNQPVQGWREDEAKGITWNEEALPFLREEYKPGVYLDEQGQLVWNADEEEKLKVEEPKKKKSDIQLLREKKKADFDKKSPKIDAQGEKAEEGVDPNVDPKLKESEAPYTKGGDSEPVETAKSLPSQQAFGNINPQQGKYRDPTDTHGQDNVQPMEDQQPVPGAVDTSKGTGGMFKEGEGSQGPSLNLLYARVFPEALTSIIQYEQNIASPRFGQPVMYRVTLNDPMQQQSGVGLPLSTVEVHYSRIIHINDVGSNFTSSEIFSAPCMRPVLNNLIDLQKIYGAVGEGYWKNAFATLAAETHPQLGGDVTIDTADLRSQMKKWRDSTDRVLAATGITWRTLSPQVVDPNSYVQNELNAICIKLGCPLRVFMGSEQGVLASGQDAVAWYFRVKERRINYIIPRIIVPIIDRLIKVGVLPRPVEYSVSWNEDQKLTPSEQAQIGGAVTGALATYISGQVDQFIEPVTYLVEVLGWDREKAKSAVETTMQHLQKQQEAQAAQGQQMIDPTTGQPLEQDEMGQFIDPNTGEPLQTDEFGKPVMIDPQTGEPIPVQQQSAGEAQGPLGAEAALGENLEDENQFGEEDPEMVQESQGDQAMEQGQEGIGAGFEEGVDQETGLPIDPETGYLIHEQSGMHINKETGDVIDPETGETVMNIYDEEGEEPQGGEELQEGEEPQEDEEQPITADEIREDLQQRQQQPGGMIDGQAIGEDQEPIQEVPQEGQPNPEEEEAIDPDQAGAVSEPQEAEYPTDPKTGRLIDPESGWTLDPNTGDLFDESGQPAGNVNDEENQEEALR